MSLRSALSRGSPNPNLYDNRIFKICFPDLTEKLQNPCHCEIGLVFISRSCFGTVFFLSASAFWIDGRIWKGGSLNSRLPSAMKRAFDIIVSLGATSKLARPLEGEHTV